ncbi:MAG: dTDP-4-dehydrorhamnose reductase [Verrucomicrobiae bacterium]|nr:dTDP-4-dehydrorhamnose reductase [Verrucomicrobiae bacterium]
MAKPHKTPRTILLLGSRGLLGNTLLPALRQTFESVRCMDRAELNLANPGQVEKVLTGVDFDLLVNAAGYTAVDDCEINERLAYLVNSDAPAILAKIAAAKGAQMVQFSTDYVFDGGAFLPYKEGDPANPISIYGKSKCAGEIGVLAADSRHLVVRLSWLFGPGRTAFPGWVLRKAVADGRVSIVSDKSASPTFAPDLANWLIALLLSDKFTGGMVHLCNSGVCTWKDYGEEVLRCAVKTGLLKEMVPVHPLKLTDLPGLTAARPLYSALDTTHFSQITGVTPRPWQDAVAEHVTYLSRLKY